MRSRGFLLAAVLLGSAAGWAAAYADPPNTVGQVLGAALSRGVLTYPLRRGQLQTKLAPAYAMNEFDENHGAGRLFSRMDGWSATAALAYGLTDRWGLAALAGYASISGPRSVNLAACDRECGSGWFSPPKAAGRTVFDGQGEGEGVAAAAALVWDPRSGEGFRFPLYLGLGYTSIDETADDRALGLKVVGRTRSPTAFAGLSPGFNLGSVRIVGYVMLFAPVLDSPLSLVDYDPATGAVDRREDYDLPAGAYGMVGAAGVELTYRPWGLGVTWVPPLNEGANAYSVKWSRRWDVR